MSSGADDRGRAAHRQPPALGAAALRRTCRAGEVPVASTAGVPPARVIGQPRVLEALALAASMRADGAHHVFATGPAGTGRRAAVEAWLRERAAAAPTPPDIVYLFNFAEPLRPRAYALAPGSGRAFAADMDQVVAAARRRIGEAFESESFRTRHRALHDDLDRRRGDILRALEQRARAAGVALQLTPAGVITLPIVAGRPLAPNELEGMRDDQRERFERAVEELKGPVQEAFAAIHDAERDAETRHVELTREVATFAVGVIFDDVRRRWSDEPGIPEWLDEVREDVLAHLDLFRAATAEPPEPAPPVPQPAPAQELRARYAVNVLVSREPDSGAPIVIPTDPSFYELFGRAEYETAFGAARTDHRHLRAGAVHEAAGGWLVLDAGDLLTTPGAWPRLKDVLRSRRARIENLAVQYMLFPGVTLDPDPVEVPVTVVLIGTPDLYELLNALDDDVARLFKLRADFDDEMPRDADGVRSYAGLLARLRDDHGTLDFDRRAIAAIVEHGSREAGHRDRLTTRVRVIADVAAEASEAARAAGADRVGAPHVAAALRGRRRRSSRPEERLREETLAGTIRVATEGSAAGQVNGLAISAAGDHLFGHPVRISATAGPGDGTVVGIDREAKLSGPIHDKGLLILEGYLTGRYGREAPLSLRASVVFEQSYGPIEGDSASAAELFALLSAIAGIPADQAIAVTGSVDQHGRIQAIGGVNEKIEGFFALCRDGGLTGSQGVLVPAANLPHLMLDEEVVAAVRRREFRVYPMTAVEDGVARITGMRAATIHARVAARLAAFAEAAQAGRDGG